MEISLSWEQDEEGKVVPEPPQYVACRWCGEVWEITEECDLEKACPGCGEVM